MRTSRWRMVVASLLCVFAGTAHAADWFVATNGNDSADGTTWATAKLTLQAGVDAATGGDTVFVSNGVYSAGGGVIAGGGSNRVAIVKSITVQSASGPAATVIVGDGMRCAYVTNGAELSGFTLTNGVASEGGGAWCEEAGRVVDCVLTGNGAEGGGGGSWGGLLDNCSLTANHAAEGGGSYGGELNQCILSGNSVDMWGGGARGGTLNHCLLMGNDAPDGGGTVFGTLNNCTVVGNSATGNGGGAIFATLNNCIAYDNTGNVGVENHSECTFAYSCTTPDPGGTGNIANDPQFVDAGAGNYRLSVSSPCIDAGDNSQVWGTADLDGNPRIENGVVDMGAYELIAELSITPLNTNLSADVASGLAVEVTASVPWTATTNVPWLAITSGDSGTTNGTVIYSLEANDGASPRTGAVIVASANSSRTCMVIQADTSSILEIAPTSTNLSADAASGRSVEVTASVPWTAATNAPWLEITSGESGATNGTVMFRAGANGGTTRIGVLIVAGGGIARTCTVIQAAGEGVTTDWHVATNGNDSADGTTWATAKLTLQAGVDAATGGDTVFVSNGVYSAGGGVIAGGGSNRVAIVKSITVQSANGPEATVIVGGGMRCAYVTNGAELSGFTLTNGVASEGGGAWCEEAGRVVDCVLTGNGAEGGGGGSWGGVLDSCSLTANHAAEGGGSYGGELNQCILSGNSADMWGGGARGGTLNHCLLMGNGAPDGGGTVFGTLNNCTVVGNSATGNGGGATFATLNNCIAYENTGNVGVENHSECTFAYSCTTPDPGGTGNIANDPQFGDAGAGNYRLSVRSPCIDAGDNSLVSGDEDLAGNPRIAYGTVDMGAYEAQLAGAGTWFDAITNGLTNDTECVAGDNVPNLLKYATGSSPRISDDLMLIEWVLNNGVPTLRFNRNPNATDVIMVIQGADAMSNGATWRGVATNSGGSWGGAANVSESGTGVPVTCTVEDIVPLLTNRFLRLKVTRP